MEALINFQTMVAGLTGMEIANASLLDEATAAAEAITLAQRSSRSTTNVFFVSNNMHPQTLEVLRTPPGGQALELPIGDDPHAASVETFGVLLQYPDPFPPLQPYPPPPQTLPTPPRTVALAPPPHA